MAKCVKQMINCTCKINILRLPNTKKIGETKENRKEMAKCFKQMITCTCKINISRLPNTKKIEEK